MLRRCPNVPDLYYVRGAGVLGSYGGGDYMQMARSIACLDSLPNDDNDDDGGGGGGDDDNGGRLAEFVRGQVRDALEAYSNSPEQKAAAHLPSWDTVAAAATPLRTQVSFHVSSGVMSDGPNRQSHNMMYHGWLYRDIGDEPERLGRIEYPLVGCCDSEGIVFGDQSDVASLGDGRLQWSDQHIHRVNGDWHFGSDMSRFTLAPHTSVASGWMVAVDLPRMCAHVMLVWIVHPDHEALFDAAIDDSCIHSATDLEAVVTGGGIVDILSPAQVEQFRRFCMDNKTIDFDK